MSTAPDVEETTPTEFRLVILESPFAGDTERNKAYARACMRDCLLRDEAPFASHLLYTQDGVLDDDKPDERDRGINAGLAWGERAEATVVYTDLDISSGMQRGIERAKKAGRPVEMRTLAGWKSPASTWILDGSEIVEPLIFKYWKECERVASHFNDLLVKFRLQALGGLTLATGALGAVGEGFLGGGLVVLACFWAGAALIDWLYYGRLLRGAVNELLRVEEKMGDLVQLSTQIEAVQSGGQTAMKPKDGKPATLSDIAKQGRLNANIGRAFFFGLPLAILVTGAVLVFCGGLSLG